MTTRIGRWLTAVPVLVGGLAVLAACGSDRDGGAGSTRFTGPAGAGETVYRTNGCGACHGTAYQGGTGPTLVGLAGSTVTLSDGSQVTADRTYLTRALSDPQSQQVKGYALKMPVNNLSAEQIDQLVALIQALGT